MTFKSIKISDSTHEALKMFCKQNTLKLNAWVESLIVEKLYQLSKERNTKIFRGEKKDK